MVSFVLLFLVLFCEGNGVGVGVFGWLSIFRCYRVYGGDFMGIVGFQGLCGQCFSFVK